MADLFAVYKTDGSRANTICVMSPQDFVFFAAPVTNPGLRQFCENHPHVGSLVAIIARINSEIDAQSDLLRESLACHAEAVNKAYLEASPEKQNDWIYAWLGTRLDPWVIAGWVDVDDWFGVALADLPQVLLSGMTKDFRLALKDYTSLLYRSSIGAITPRLEAQATRLELGGDRYVEAEDYPAGRPDLSGSDRLEGDEVWIDRRTGEVCEPVREGGQDADSLGEGCSPGPQGPDGLS